MKVKFTLEAFSRQKSIEVDFDEDSTPNMIDEALNDWVDGYVYKWYDIIEE